MKDIDKRECYKEEEKQERFITLQSTQSLSRDYKKWPTELWMKVIQRAIEDAALARKARHEDRKLSRDMEDNEDSALSFLFNDDHRIPFDDFTVEVQCPKCNRTWLDSMSKVSAEPSRCECRYVISTKYIEYRIKDEVIEKDISLQELLSIWNINDIEGFRDGCWDRIEEMSGTLELENKKCSAGTNKKLKEDIIHNICLILENKTIEQLYKIEQYISNI